MGKLKERLVVAGLAALYAVFAFRYYPGRPRDSLIATLEHLLESLPFIVGVTVIVVVVMQRLAEGRLPWDRIARIFLTIAIIFEFFYGLHHYLDINLPLP